MKRKGTRRCLHQDTKSLITPSLHLCFALTCCLFVCYECIRQSKQHNILTSNCLRNMLCCGLGRNKDDGVMSDFVSWCRHLLVPFLFHEVTSLHPPSFHRNDFSTCSTHFSFGAKPQQKCVARARIYALCTRMCTRTTPGHRPPPYNGPTLRSRRHWTTTIFSVRDIRAQVRTICNQLTYIHVYTP